MASEYLSQNQPVLALVPARAGSKGVPGKNMVNLLGRPLVEYTIRAALDAKSIDSVWLSSDDMEILEFGSKLGVQPLLRPSEYATDEASSIGVVQHFLSTLPKDLLQRNPFIVYLQPTSPLRTAKHIDDAFQELHRCNASSLISVMELDKSPFKAFQLDERGRLLSLFDERLSNARRQDLPKTFVPDGAIYIFSVSDFVNRGGFPSNGSLPFVLDQMDSVDIDTPDDLIRAAKIMALLANAVGSSRGEPR